MTLKRSKINILYISPNGFMGGAEKFVYNAALGHNSEDINPTFLFLNDGSCKKEVEQLGRVTTLLPFKLKLSNIFSLIRSALFIRKHIKSNNIDIVHSTMPYAHIVTFISSIGLEIKMVWFQHGPVSGVLDSIANLLPVAEICFNSSYLQEEHNKMIGAKRNVSKQTLINYGNEIPSIDTKNVTSIRTKHSSNHDLIFATVGRICDWKGQLNVLQALNELKDHSIKYLIIGSANSKVDKDYEKSLHKYVKENNLNNSVEFISHVKNVHDYMSAIDLLIHSSTIPEPFGLVVSEAMLSKCLILGGDAGGVLDILHNKETGHTFAAASKDPIRSLINALINIIPVINDSENIKRNAYELISNKYSIEQMINSLEVSYRNIRRTD